MTFDTGLMARLSLVLPLLLCFADVHGEPVIELYPEGQIRGTTMTTRNGRNISAFLGIPYAEPPVGRLRFRATKMRELYGDIMANVDGNQCPQLNDDGVVVGDEDCLYLNIYTPDINAGGTTEDLRPTMVYFHGGNFEKGSGSSVDAGPEYLLDRDIVLVTVNYRLGVLGFLSTEDWQAPGNCGLKDQVAALEWIRSYIMYFGGATHPVTIFGQGAGGVSTSLHAISDQSMNLFDRYIAQSGNVLSTWAIGGEPGSHLQRARNLGKYLRCLTTGRSAYLVRCLQNMDAYSLVASADAFNRAADTSWITTPWGPVQEKEADGAFLTMYPLHKLMLYQNGVKDCPAIIGNVRNEGLIFTAGLYADDTKYDAIARNLTTFVRSTLTRFFSPNPYDNPNEMFEDFYFKDISPDEDRELLIRNITNFVTDSEFRRGMELLIGAILIMVESSVYSYTFDYRGTFSKTSTTIGNNDDVGVTHGDDLIYLFPIKNNDFKPSESDEKMIDIMVDFWTSFARTGIPTSQYLDDPNVWEPNANATELTLHIGENDNPTDMQLRSDYDPILAIWNGAFVTVTGF